MNKILLLLTWLILYTESHAQKLINLKGQIQHVKTSETIYLVLDEVLIPLKLQQDGTFQTNTTIQQVPSFFFFAKISKSGKIEQQTPRIWFDNDTVEVSLDWQKKSFQKNELLPFQSFSEKIESLGEQHQMDYILNNPNTLPSIYFAEYNKEKFKIADLESFTKAISDEYKTSAYFKRVENFILAKSIEPLKVGIKFINFKLPNKNDEDFSIIQRENKTNLIVVHSSGCSFSIASIDLLHQLYNINQDRISITSIWKDKSEDTWLNLYKDKKDMIKWTNLWDEFGFAKAYLNVDISPYFFVVNKEGVLIDKFYGYDKRTVEKLKKLIE